MTLRWVSNTFVALLAGCTMSVVLTQTVVSQSSVGAARPQRLPTLTPGIHDETMPIGNGGVIRYAISIPPNYISTAHVPLILALHFAGGAGSGRDVLEFLVKPALVELGAIIIAPDSIDGDWSSPANQRGVNALIDAALASYGIDAKKIAVTGYSMGGAGTWFWAGAYPDRFSAAVPVAGFPSSTAAAWRIPVFAVHSRDDQVMPIGPTEQRIAELKKMGKNAEIVILTGITHFQTDRHVDGLRRAVPWLKELWK